MCVLPYKYREPRAVVQTDEGVRRNVEQAEEFNFAVVMTNQMTSDPGGGMTFVSDPKKPIGGHVLAHVRCVHICIYVPYHTMHKQVMCLVPAPGVSLVCG